MSQNTDYLHPEDTANGHLGACHLEPKDHRGTRIDAFPIRLVADSIIRREDHQWGDDHKIGDFCPHGMWGPNYDKNNEMPWCDDGDGCRILSYLWDMRRGDEFPELVVIHRDGKWLVDDGYHRLGAWAMLGYTHVPAIAFSDYGPDDPAIRAHNNNSGDQS